MLIPEEDREEQEIEEVEEVVFYLWDTLKDIYLLYRTIIPYLGEYYSLSNAGPLIIKLCEEKGLSLEDVLNKIPYINNEYSSILIEYHKAQAKAEK